ncbi:FAD/NAD(P)-binding domain-containing protein [Lophiostoma macrostomum CBS 122681]|uniref:FAD/NAD(P)-binding domain-containing protein n=1 Tax=Lophiostoma macrostomum CBS 122681 TaxID=1314788 RepID=A0A6A6SIV7_9PLEO|nr:FAD/NAD(P)-binding domain-containing protein [Lophiostoma macrostomum CBS 122681]
MPLKIIVVGAGLGGLAAAIALTRAGHYVEVYEKSLFHNEVGAAIHLAPNATRILQPWIRDLQTMNPVICDHLSLWDNKGNFVATPAFTDQLQKKLGIDEPWLLVHRVDLHNALRAKAEESFGGKKPTIHLNSTVDSVDSSTGKVVLEHGHVLQADLVIGADGVHSRTVNSVTSEIQEKKSTGQNCFRFLVPIEKLRADPITNELIDRIGLKGLNAFTSPERRLVLYPCRGGTLINAVMYYPEEEGETAESSWQNAGSQDKLMAQMESFSLELRKLCSMAEDLKDWSLASRDPPPVFYRGKVALIGDAAHPTLPHQGQGGAQALEDAATLGALFTADTRPEQISERLKLYNDIRYEQAVTVLFMSRVGDEYREKVMGDLKRFVPDAKLPENMWLHTWKSFPVKEVEYALKQRGLIPKVNGA